MRRSWLAYIGPLGFVIAFSSASAQANSPASASGQSPQQITVTAKRLSDHKALVQAVTGFVASHAAPGARLNQIGRWHENVCPLVTGLQPSARDFVKREILDVARAAGAPTWVAGKKCDNNVEIVFTTRPQALLDHIAKSYQILLGYYPSKSQRAQVTKFTRPIQAWYETGTRTLNSPFAQLDSYQTAVDLPPPGESANRFDKGQRSEFVHVLIIADSSQLSQYPLRAIADYLAVLSLTRMSQPENCAPLASITDLLANGCPSPVADKLTAADGAYLKALYTADLEKDLHFEHGDIHDRMMQTIEGK